MFGDGLEQGFPCRGGQQVERRVGLGDERWLGAQAQVQRKTMPKAKRKVNAR